MYGLQVRVAQADLIRPILDLVWQQKQINVGSAHICRGCTQARPDSETWVAEENPAEKKYTCRELNSGLTRGRGV